MGLFGGNALDLNPEILRLFGQRNPLQSSTNGMKFSAPSNPRAYLDPRHNPLSPTWYANRLFGADNDFTKGLNFLQDPAGLLTYNDPRRNRRRLEAEYLPRADAAQRLAMQRANYGGTAGGAGTAQGELAYADIIRMLDEEDRKFRDMQSQKDQQALGTVMSIIPFL